jgi:hypothetical protein
MPKVSMMKGRASMSKGRVTPRMPTLAVMTEEMVGKGKKEVSGLLLKIETPKKYISFK